MHSQAEKEVIFEKVLLAPRGGLKGEVVNLAVLACALRTTTKVVNFLKKKKYTPKENPGYAYALLGKRGYTSPVPLPPCSDAPGFHHDRCRTQL